MNVIAHPRAASTPLPELAFNTLGGWLAVFGATVERESFGGLERLRVRVGGLVVTFASPEAILVWLAAREDLASAT